MNRLLKVFLAIGLIGGFAFSAQGVESAAPSFWSNIQNPAGSEKLMREFHGVKLGMKRDEVHTAAGKPENSSENSEDYKLTGEDTMTVHYDGEMVKAIQLAFLDPKNAPPWKDVVGEMEASELPNGAKTARKTIETEKFWVSIYQSKDGSLVRITISRL